jgi:multidrug efflux pump subunit AcrB
MWAFFVHHNRFSYLLIAALIATGFYAITVTPKESSPEVQIPIGIVTTILPGAPAADVEALVTNEIERGLAGSLTDVKKITSTSRESVSSVVVEFNASADIDTSIDELKSKVDALQPELPDTAEDSVVTEVDFVDQPIMSIAVAAPVDPYSLALLAREIERELEALPGISKVVPVGAPEREVSVVVRQNSLAQFGLTLQDVTGGLALANRTFPVGQIVSDGVSYNVAFEGDISDASLVAQVPIGERGGQPIYLRDVAEVIDGVSDPATQARLSIGGKPSETAISFDVYKQRGNDITRVTDALVERLDELQQPGALLDGHAVEVPYNAGADIKKDLVNLSSSGLQTVALVMIVLFLTIGWREALIAGASVPLSFLIGFIGLYYSGNTINFLSLFALILGVGILVDSGIVMVEGINRRMKENPTIDKKEAALLAVNEFASPLISGTLTTVVMFSGLFVISGIIGQFISSIPFTLIFILLASLFVALGVLPLLSATFLHRRNTSDFEVKQLEASHKVESWYRKHLSSILDNPKSEKKFIRNIRIALFIAILLPIVGVVEVIFFPQSDIDFMYAEVELPVGTVRETTDVTLRQVEEVLYKDDSVKLFLATVGGGSQFGSGGSDARLGNIFIVLKEDRDVTSSEVVARLQKEVQGISTGKVVVSQPNNGPPTGSAISITFRGDDLGTLTDTSVEAAQLLNTIPGVTNIQTSASRNGTEYVLTLNKDRVAALGLTPQSVSAIARAAVYGTDATTLTTLTDEIDVVVKLQLASTETIDPHATNEVTISALSALPVTTPAGTIVPLGSLVDISLRESSSAITHTDGEREMSVSADVLPGVNSRDVQAEFLTMLEEKLAMPEGVTMSSAGESDDSNKAFMEMLLALIVGVLLMFGVIVYEFNSFLHTRYVLSILPYSLIGIFAGLAITQNPLSFPSLMGFIALSGIVVNNSILLIDMMNAERRKYPNKSIRDVVLDAATSRLRPILLTTTTTVVGMIPLALAGDTWGPLAYAVMFGLFFSVIITLVLIPIIYHRKPGELT